MSDAPPIRSPTRPISGYEFASRVLSRFPEDGVQMLLDFAGGESDWLEKKAGVYPWGKDDEVVKLREQGEAIYERDYPCLEHKLCRTIVEAIVSLYNLRGGVVFIGINDSKENRVVPLRENDPKGFLEKDVDNYIRNAVEPRIWPDGAYFEEKNGTRRLVAPVPKRDAVFRTECVRFKGETILAVLVHERAPDAPPLSFSFEPKKGAASTEVVYRSPGSKGCVARLSVDSVNDIRDFQEHIRPKSLSNYDLAEQAARWGIVFPEKIPHGSIPHPAATIAVLAAFLLVASAVVLFFAFSDDKEDGEDEAADFRPVPATVPSVPVSVQAVPAATQGPASRERSGTTAVRPVSPPSTVPTPSGGFDRTVTIDDVYRSAKRTDDKTLPTESETGEWDEEDRFVARRDLKKLLLGWKKELLEMCADPDDPAPDAQGIAVLSAGKTFLVGELESSGAAKLVLDGGRLVAQRPSAEEVRAARARWDALLADVEADRVPDERLRDGIDFAKKEFDALGLHDGEPPPSLSVPVEVGPAGGILEGMSGPCDVLGKFVPGPRGAGVIAIRGTASFRENGLSPDVPLEGAYTILDSAGEYVHLHLPPVSPANAHGSNPEQSFREACETARRPHPDGNGDIVVRSGETLILSDVPLDGSVKRIVLRGGTLAFLPPASDRNGFVEIMTFDLPIVVGKEGGEIGACRWTDTSLRRLRGVGEARLRSPVSNEFGERPSVVVCGDVFLDADRFSPKVRAVTFREFPRPVASPVFGGHGAPSDRLSPRTELDPGTGDYRFCDFRGPFPVSSNRKH